MCSLLRIYQRHARTLKNELHIPRIASGVGGYRQPNAVPFVQSLPEWGGQTRSIAARFRCCGVHAKKKQAPALAHPVMLGVILGDGDIHERRSEEHTSELQSLMRISYAVFC